MKRMALMAGAALVLVLGMGAGAGYGDPQGGESPAPGMNDPETMKKWQAYATPSEAHQQLVGMIGSWDAVVKMWPAPGAPPVESAGTSENTAVLGGRFIRQTFQGEVGGMPYEGLGYVGYDNAKREYISIWMDSMGTGWMTSTGSGNPEGTHYTYVAEFDDPMTGHRMKIREEIRVLGPEQHVMEMYMVAPGGAEFKNLEIAYTRQK